MQIPSRGHMNTYTKLIAVPKEDTQFKPGNPGGPGRPRGTRSYKKIIGDMIELDIPDNEPLHKIADRLGLPDNERTWKAIISAQLVKKAAEGSLKAIEMMADRKFSDDEEVDEVIQIKWDSEPWDQS